MKDWTTLRAGLSSGITLILVIHYVLQSKVIKNYLSIGFAFLFHTQSIAAVPIYYLNKLKLTKKKLLITLFVIILVSAAINLKDLLLNFMVLLKVINSRSVEYLFNDFFWERIEIYRYHAFKGDHNAYILYSLFERLFRKRPCV